MKFRQINLDFHTSEEVPGIGSEFSKEQFQAALKAGHVDSINLFAKCHHGWSYYPSKLNRMHPNLKFDLLGEQIKAAKEIGVATPIYYSVGIDYKTSLEHREWASVCRQDYEKGITDPFSTDYVGYRLLCLNTPYLDMVLDQLTEILETYPADGLFLDIVKVRKCYCPSCIAMLKAKGKNPNDPAAILEQGEEIYANYTRRVYETVQKVRPGLPIFHNGGHIPHGRRDLAHMNSHLELESLPTGGWGYDHFPISASYARALNMDYLGMTGKFHKGWGEFGGFKHPNALRYEVALDLANGAACSVGDQLHPNGKMDMVTYELIGKAYAEVEEKEPWAKGFKNISDIAVIGTEAIENYEALLGCRTKDPDDVLGDADRGCSRILLEGHYLFDFVDTQTDLSGYKLLILPDCIRLDEALKEKIKVFVEAGGKVIATGTSGLYRDKESFALDFGCEYMGENEYRPDYFRPQFDIPNLGSSAFVMYSQGYKIQKTDGTEYGTRENPYFNRSKEHFSSHQHTPNNTGDSHPAYLEGKDGIYIAWNIFEDYALNGSFVSREMIKFAIEKLMNKSIETDLPVQGVLTLTHNGSDKVVHHLYASPVKRGTGVEIIEDIVPLYHIHTKVYNETCPKRVYLAPQREDIPFKYENGYVSFEVEKLENHQMVVIENS